jgi:hypothetical protein
MKMYILKHLMLFFICMACTFLVNIHSAFALSEAGGRDILIIEWSGDYLVKHLDQLPEGQRTTSVGYINDAKTFAAVWQVFKPDEKLPEVDFSTDLIVFVRNVNFYNKIKMLKCTLTDGTAEVLAMETMSAMPIENKVGMALAMVPRDGLKLIRAGETNIPVPGEITSKQSSAKSPDQACYVIEKQEICLINGQIEVAAAPGSTTKIKTSFFGQPVYGDIDGDGTNDAVMLLVQNSGGSGIFYYVAAAFNTNGTFTGTNAIFLGDRISPQNVEIRDGMIIANYADRSAHEPMTTPPSIGISKYLVLKENKLTEMTH